MDADSASFQKDLEGPASSTPPPFSSHQRSREVGTPDCQAGRRRRRSSTDVSQRTTSTSDVPINVDGELPARSPWPAHLIVAVSVAITRRRATTTTSDDGDDNVSLWNDEEGFYFDAITWGPGASKQLPIRSLVGLIPLYATLTLEPASLKKFPGFKKRMEWFIENRPELSERNMANMKGMQLCAIGFMR